MVVVRSRVGGGIDIYIFIYMPAIDGQTAGPTGLKFYLEYPRGNIKGKRNSFFFKNRFFFKIRFKIPRATPGTSAS